MNRLNEELLRVPNMDEKEKLVKEPVEAVDPSYNDAINGHEKLKKNVEDSFKEQEKEKEAFIKDTDRTEVKVKTTPEMKKMKLSESLFEDYNDAPDEYQKIFNVLDNIEHLVSATMDWSDADWTVENTKQTRDMLHDEMNNLTEFIRLVERKVDNAAIKNEELEEAFEYGNATNMGQGYTAPLVDDYTSDITQLIKIIDEGDEHFAKPSLKRIVKRLFDNKQSVENFNAYWEERYPASIDTIDKQLELIGPMLLKELLGDSVEESMNEATAVAEPTIVYKKKRPPLAEIIMAELSEGEVVYRKSPEGKLTPTNGPHLNIDDENVGANSDDKGEYIIAWVDTEELANDVAAIGDKYSRETVTGNDKYVADTPWFTKIYITDADWEEPFVDPNAPTR